MDEKGWIRRNYNLVMIALVWILTLANIIASLLAFHRREQWVFRYGTKTVPWFDETIVSVVSSNLTTAIFITAFLLYFHKKLSILEGDESE